MSELEEEEAVRAIVVEVVDEVGWWGFDLVGWLFVCLYVVLVA